MIVVDVERRVLAALRFRDVVTDLALDRRFSVTAAGVRFIRNRRSLWVVAAAPGLESHESSFDRPQPAPPEASIAIELTVIDPAGEYLSRRVTVRLPRDADPAQSGAADSLFSPIDVTLFPSPAAPTWPGWAVVRATTRDANGPTPLAGALIRVVRDSDQQLIGRGMSDDRGEALVAVQGIPVTTFSATNGPVLATEQPVTLEIIHDPGAPLPPDPDDLEDRRAALTVNTTQVSLASGRISTMTI